MKARNLLLQIGSVAMLAVALANTPLCAKEPANLDPAKREIRRYVTSGEYFREIAAVTAEATTYLEQRAKQGGKRLTVVFDLDETLFSNLPLMEKQDFGYVPEAWNAWVVEGKAPVIAPVGELFRAARRLGLDVVLISGRHRDRDRAGTEKNLRAIGCTDYAELILKPDASARTTGGFKLEERRRLMAEGRTIVANIGDQESDFEGGVAERNFKLPDPFYITK